MKNLYLPKDTSKAKPNQIDNFALRLNKYPPSYEKFNKNIRETVTEFALNHHEKKKNIHCKVKLDFQNSQKQILAFSAKYLFSLQQLADFKVETSAFQPDWRLIVGLGSASVYETSITLHHIYGFPYIPGQAVKGVTRNYVICEYFEKNKKKAENNTDFKKIFGLQEQKGKITFFDAYPQTKPKLDFDIMNVHYPDYYSGKSEPTDDQNPNPITFLTVKDTTFFFPIAYPKDKEPENFTIEGKSVSGLIKSALEEKGIGAKSSVGYGYLKNSKDSDPIFDKELKRFEEQKNAKIEAAKPEWEKLSENLNWPFPEVLEFLKSPEKSMSDKEKLAQNVRKYFLNIENWEKKKLNGQEKEFANSAFNFLNIIAEKDEIVLNIIKKYGGKKLMKKIKKWR